MLDTTSGEFEVSKGAGRELGRRRLQSSTTSISLDFSSRLRQDITVNQKKYLITSYRQKIATLMASTSAYRADEGEGQVPH